MSQDPQEAGQEAMNELLDWLTEDRQQAWMQQGSTLTVLFDLAREQSLEWIGDYMEQAQEVRERLQQLVDDARRKGATWADIARAASITPQAAQRRWDPEARKRRNDYQRKRAGGSGTNT